MAKDGMDEAVYVRMTTADRRALEAAAAKDERDLSFVVRKAVRLYLAGGAEQLAKQERALARPTEEEEAGRWLLGRSLQNRHILWKIGEALERNEDLPAGLGFLHEPRRKR